MAPLVPRLLALFTLRGRDPAGTTLAFWALIIVAVPILCALAVGIVQPGNQAPAARTQGV